MSIFYKKENMLSSISQSSYSTGETRIGTWIDGKPLYEITVKMEHGPIPNKTWIDIGQISNMSYGMIVGGCIKENESPNRFIDLQCSLFRLSIGSDGIIRFYPENFSSNSSTTWVTVRYTKTTDD